MQTLLQFPRDREAWSASINGPSMWNNSQGLLMLTLELLLVGHC